METLITGRSCLAEADDFLLDTINPWLYSLVLKVLPCFVLTIITGFLIKALYKAEERSARLKVCQEAISCTELCRKKELFC